jgi:GT2 family glycosyltransferase
LGAVSGVYLDPKRTDAEQCAPKNFKDDVNYAGLIDHNVPWPYTCRYPDGTKPRSVEHLYSSFLYRVEVADAIGGYCKLFSQIGHREESDFSYRFWLAGFTLKIHPEAIGYHFCAPNSGIRSIDINEKNALAETDHKIYSRRLQRWKFRSEQRREIERKKRESLDLEAQEMAKKNTEPKTSKMTCVINCGDKPDQIKDAIRRFAPLADSIYVTCEVPSKDSLSEIMSEPGMAMKIKSIGTTPEESALIAQTVAARGDHEFVMTVSDQMRFSGDPRSVLSANYDEYVFEVYETYRSGVMNENMFTPDETAPVMIGRECRNQCLIFRRNCGKPTIERILYSDVMVIEETKHIPEKGVSRFNNSLVKLDEIGTIDWTKICVYQHPHGQLKNWSMKEISNGSPLVSIIIPTPGRKIHLKRCLDSIYAYTTTSFELIIVDNGSSDGTEELIANESKVRSNIVYLKQVSNWGFQKGVNIGVTQAKGKYILIFNDDAWVEKPEPDGGDWLSVLMRELDVNPKVGIVGPHEGIGPALGKKILMFWCVMLKRSTWDDVGPLDDVTFLNYGGDDDYCERLKQKGYEIKTQHVSLRHLMNLVPENVKSRELEDSRVKLRSKYNVG